MVISTILLTNADAAGIRDFTEGQHSFVFGLLDEGLTLDIADGPVWAFVDWVLPDLSGLEMCRRLRADNRLQDAHITMVLERDHLDDRRRALQAGADDYILGPIDEPAIRERVLALCARPFHTPLSLQIIEAGEFTVDLAAHLARYRNQPIRVRPNQFRLLRHFLDNPNRVLSREELVDALHREGPPVNPRTVDKWIGRLREALDTVGAGHLLRTVHFEGYVLDIG